MGSYQYSLGPTGNRTAESEYTGRQVSWTPDDLYRLTGEVISNDPVTANDGAIGYTYDNVGNRNQRTSSVSIIGTQSFTGGYSPADELKPTFSFDGNGNQTTDSQGRTYTYNALNQLTRVQGTGVDVSYLYDGDGLRVEKSNNLTGVVTNYLWDRNNLTGFPQVSEELQNGQVVRRYVYGPRGPLYMVQLVNGSWVTSYFGMDAQNVRFLMNDAGQVTDTYTWDAFGNLLSSTGTTANNVGAFGEYADSDTGFVYLRARWYNPAEGRFMEMDSYEGDPEDPLTLNKYVGFEDNGVDKTDPSGNQVDFNVSLSVNLMGANDGPVLRPSFPDLSNLPTVDEVINRGKALINNPHVSYAHEYQGSGNGSSTVPLSPRPTQLDCSEFISYCFQAPLYRTWEFFKNPFFMPSYSLDRGNVIIWSASNPKDKEHAGATEGHAAIYTGEGGDNAILHSSFSKGVALTANNITHILKNKKHYHYQTVIVRYYRDIDLY